jgi:beta-galactosidase
MTTESSQLAPRGFAANKAGRAGRRRLWPLALLTLAAAGWLACPPSQGADLASPAPANSTLRQQTLMDLYWQFHPGDVESSNEVVSVGYDDKSWQTVNVPHDYVLDASGNYSSTNDRNHGYLPVQPAWYRKHFFIPQTDHGKTLQLEFEGIFRDSQIWLNGQFLGEHPSGYTPIELDISKATRYGTDNVLVVRVDPRRYEGWWYEGGGIYRHVRLRTLDPLHVATWGACVVSTVRHGNEGEAKEAELAIETTVQNDGPVPARCSVVSRIIDPKGKPVLKLTQNAEPVPPGGSQQVVQHELLPNPRLWSVDSPSLYRLETTVLRNGRPVDLTTNTFGIRTIYYDPDKGFFLNGRHLEIRGVACHQDFAGVGIAVPDSLQPWRVSQLKKMGCNAWRTAHNPPNESVLDACDRLGMMVMDENRHLGDTYTHHSPKGTAFTNLSDLATMIQRDRNHPSIIMWSMCNEEGLQKTPEGAAIFSAMKEVVRRYDQTRPVTCAMNEGWLGPGIADVEDIIGVNYSVKKYDDIHQKHPRQAMFGSETANNKTTRGEYASDPTNGWVTCYNLTEDAWLPVAGRPFLAGSFTWTGFDYKGEPNPYGWPDISNNTGLLDVCGFPKDKYFYLESCWSDKPMVHVLPASWNWPGKEGQEIRVIVFSNAERVELFRNGQSLGAVLMPKDGHVEWQVPYQPGQLVAKAYRGDTEVATDTEETTGPPARLQVSAERTLLDGDGEDAVAVRVAVVDAQGRVVPDADNRVEFHLEGAGRILGVGNGNPSDHDSDKAPQRKAFHGRCLAVVQAAAHPGARLKLTVSSAGLASANLALRTR